MRRNIAAVVFTLGLMWGTGAQAQTQSMILTIDSEQVFNLSLLGQQITKDLEMQLEVLTSENRRIENELVAEELELTEQRAALEAVAFRKLADVFDAKVQRIRVEQDTKQRTLQRMREDERQSFIDAIAPILSAIGLERGAVIVFERRDVLLSADSIDITQEAIDRINEALAPSEPEPPEPEDAGDSGQETLPEDQ